jgi:hypothetical protein
MFPIDSIPAAYHEEREAADSGKRLAHIQQQQAKVHAAQVAAALKAAQQAQPTTQQPSAQRPPLTRPVSSTVFGNIFQGFVRSAQSTPQARSIASGSTTPITTPPEKVVTQAELDRALAHAQKMADRKHGADIVGPGWW